MFKFNNGQNVFVASTGQEAKIIARTEFLDSNRQPRYCIQSLEGTVQGKNMDQDWINEGALVEEMPVIEQQPPTPIINPTVRVSVPVTKGKNIRDMKVRDIQKS